MMPSVTGFPNTPLFLIHHHDAANPMLQNWHGDGFKDPIPSFFFFFFYRTEYYCQKGCLFIIIVFVAWFDF